MTALPLQRPRLLTAAEFVELPEQSEARYELQEGSIVMSPRPIPLHQLVLKRLGTGLDEMAPPAFEALPEVDVDLQLAPSGEPGSVRVPDLVVVRRDAIARVEADGGVIVASEVVLAVEVVSAGSRRTDTVVKHREYADAGIPHYWVVDPGRPVQLTACRLLRDGGYADDPPTRGMFTADQPFPVRLDLDALR